MDDIKKDELLIRIDERIKTIYNRMDKFETLFTNHLHHHEIRQRKEKHQNVRQQQRKKVNRQ
jgi:hypothetical protein